MGWSASQDRLPIFAGKSRCLVGSGRLSRPGEKRKPYLSLEWKSPRLRIPGDREEVAEMSSKAKRQERSGTSCPSARADQQNAYAALQ